MLWVFYTHFSLLLSLQFTPECSWSPPAGRWSSPLLNSPGPRLQPLTWMILSSCASELWSPGDSDCSWAAEDNIPRGLGKVKGTDGLSDKAGNKSSPWFTMTTWMHGHWGSGFRRRCAWVFCSTSNLSMVQQRFSSLSTKTCGLGAEDLLLWAVKIKTREMLRWEDSIVRNDRHRWRGKRHKPARHTEEKEKEKVRQLYGTKHSPHSHQGQDQSPDHQIVQAVLQDSSPARFSVFRKF